jgi:hypothetical protein
MRHRAFRGCLIAAFLIATPAFGAKSKHAAPDQIKQSAAPQEAKDAARDKENSQDAPVSSKAPAVAKSLPMIDASPSQPDETKTTCCEHKESEGFFTGIKWTDAAIALFTLVLAIYTAKVFYATRGLWTATKRLVTGAEDTAERQLRAYISARDVTVQILRHPSTMGAIGPVPGPIHTYSASVVLVNSGNTPARHMVMCAGHQIFYDTIPDNFDFHDPSIIVNTYLGPRCEMFTGPHVIPANAVAGAGDVLIWGWVEYNDVFKGTPRRRTEFCFRAGMNTIHGIAEGLSGFTFYGNFNAADDDCRREQQKEA